MFTALFNTHKAMVLTSLRRLVVPLSTRIQQKQLVGLQLHSIHRSISSEQNVDLGSSSDSKWPEHSFLAVANTTLEIIAEEVSNHIYSSSSPLPNADVDYSQGVLTLALGAPYGSYVLNTQTPNRQIWLSSPFSGPARYGWHPSVRLWCSTRDRHSLVQLLESELSSILQVALQFDLSSLEHIIEGST